MGLVSVEYQYLQTLPLSKIFSLSEFETILLFTAPVFEGDQSLQSQSLQSSQLAQYYPGKPIRPGIYRLQANSTRLTLCPCVHRHLVGVLTQPISVIAWSKASLLLVTWSSVSHCHGCRHAQLLLIPLIYRWLRSERTRAVVRPARAIKAARPENGNSCYYNYQHYDEGDRIVTNEPCLNCTCHNRMLMCYLRVCPFTKGIGQDCTVEKRPDQCCPVITCPEGESYTQGLTRTSGGGS
uniref:VWFC domain-containing protein n=1 Tax=Timema shepardi TaxID=629360 RepID=A0A7R9G4X5_TIMSH|nr:unnamed protein product [Timema shepardi]